MAGTRGLGAALEVSVVWVFLVVDPSTGGLAYFPAATRVSRRANDFSTGPGRAATRSAGYPHVIEGGTHAVREDHRVRALRFSHQDSPSADVWERHLCRSRPCASEVPSAACREPAPGARAQSR